MLYGHGLVMGDTMLVAVVHKVDHDKTSTTSSRFTRSLNHGSLVKGRRVWVDSENDISSTQFIDTTQNHNLGFGQGEY